MKYSLCIETIFNEHPWEERLQKAKDAGFDCCEFWTWQNKDVEQIAKLKDQLDLQIASFSGDDAYSLIASDENADYIAFARESMMRAKALGCSHLVIHSDSLCNDGSAKKLDKAFSNEEKIINIYEVLCTLAKIAEEEEVCLVLEPLNTLVDHKGYFLDNTQAAVDIIRRVGSDYIKVLYDVYHMQIMEGNVIETLQKNIDAIGYIHVADVPGRHEPGTGELNYKNIFTALKSFGYEGYVGFELEPQDDSNAAIKMIKEVLV